MSTSSKCATVFDFLALCGVGRLFATTAGAETGGYGVVVGNIGPRMTTTFDRHANVPFIVVLLKNSTIFTTYNVSADQGTSSYHFDVPVGQYTLATT